MSVTDDGEGMQTGEFAADRGLGTSIVAAVASSLDATVETADAGPGVRVSIIHHET